jgi:hypothetical protein
MIFSGLLSIIVMMFCVDTVMGSAAVINWVRENGGFFHSNLEYRDFGVYATGPININETLVDLPISLEFAACDNCEHEVIEKKIKEERLNPNSKWKIYVNTLSDNCENLLCNELDREIFTNAGIASIKILFPKLISNLTSVIISRRWDTGMRPGMDLFNHHMNAASAEYNNENNKYYLLSTKKYYTGDEVYLKYNENAVWDKYFRYGFIENKELTCDDMRAMRSGNVAQRVACIAYWKTTNLKLILDEMNVAMKYNDIGMLKGGAQWIDRNTNFNFEG